MLAERLQSVHVSLSLDLAPTIERIVRDGNEIVLCAPLVSDARHRLPRRGEAMTRANAIKYAVLSKATAFAFFERGVEGFHLGLVALLPLTQGFDPGLNHVLDAGKPASATSASAKRARWSGRVVVMGFAMAAFPSMITLNYPTSIARQQPLGKCNDLGLYVRLSRLQSPLLLRATEAMRRGERQYSAQLGPASEPPLCANVPETVTPSKISDATA